MDKEALKRINPQAVKEDGSLLSMTAQYRMWEQYRFDNSYPMIVSADSKGIGLGQIEDLPIVMGTRTIVKCRRGKNSKHFLPPEAFLRLYEDLEGHLFSVDSRTRTDAIVLLEDKRDYKNDPIAVSLALGQTVHGEKVHRITSIYGRRNVKQWLARCMEEGCKVYKNEKKERNLNDIGVQFSRRIEITLSDEEFSKKQEKSQEEETNMDKPQFAVYLTNLEKYVEGHLEGKWLDLPTSDDHIRETMEELGISEDGAKYFFTDYDLEESPFLENVLGEYESIDQLNMLATLLAEHEQDKEKIAGYICDINTDSLREVCNVIVQAEKISYQSYEFEGVEYLKNQRESAETLYGYTIAEQNGIYKRLENMGMASYVDFESYGRDMVINGGVILLEDGYISPNDSNVDLEAYSIEELLEKTGLAKEPKELPKKEVKAPRL